MQHNVSFKKKKKASTRQEASQEKKGELAGVRTRKDKRGKYIIYENAMMKPIILRNQHTLIKNLQRINRLFHREGASEIGQLEVKSEEKN